MKLAAIRGCARAGRLAALAPMLALAACGIGPGPAPTVPPAPWWQGLGDAQLSQMIERRLAQAPAAGADRTSADLAQRYIDLRAQQTALVLLAAREELDIQLVTIARQQFADGAPARQALKAAQAALAATRADQARSRVAVAALREGLAALVGAVPGALDGLPGGPIPLPPGLADFCAMPKAARRHAKRALADYDAARVAQRVAQSQAERARGIAALQAMRAQPGTSAPSVAPDPAPAATIEAERQALDSLQAEEQTRAAMSRAYVALASALGPGRDTALARWQMLCPNRPSR